MTPELTGAERYLASRMNNRDYREAYEAAVTGPMNVISLHQPYASLIMAGVKTWETRGNPPNGDMRPEGVRGLPGKRINAGDRILIHAARTWAPGWLRWYSPERSDADSDRLNVLESVGVDFHECGDNWWKIDTRSLPLGAILGSVRFEAAIPVRTHVHNPHLPKLYDWSAWVCHETDIDKLTYEIDGFPDLDISDQLLYGNWLPGGWAWELSDPIPTTEQCPVCERRRARPFPGGYPDDTRCWACNSDGCCNPIPAKGKQGVWQWTT